MDFEQLVAPLGKEKFLDGFAQGACMLIIGESERFKHLLTLDEIELRLNDGCNTLTPIQVIGEGKRTAITDQKLSWSPVATRKADVLELIRERHSFLMVNMSQINPRVARLVDSIEAAFDSDNMQADMHLYVSTRTAASGYDAHRDIPQHKIYLQVIGTTHWQVFEPIGKLPNEVRVVPESEEADCLKLAKEFQLDPGDAFYMPPAVFHKVRNEDGPRISLSIPFAQIEEDCPRMDRTYIPFKKIFESEL